MLQTLGDLSLINAELRNTILLHEEREGDALSGKIKALEEALATKTQLQSQHAAQMEAAEAAHSAALQEKAASMEEVQPLAPYAR